MGSPQPWKKLSLKSRSPWAWLIISALICANFVTFSILWSLIDSPGWAAEPNLLSGGDPAALFPLPEAAALPSEPTATATRVVIYGPTPTKTPTSAPTPTPTATNPPPATPAAIVAPSTPTVPTQTEIRQVVIISIDGLRPDALTLTDTPTLDKLIAQGAYSPSAQTISLSITLPSHASMLGGMTPDKHGIEWGVPYIGWPGINGPTLFSLAHQAGLSTAMVFGKEKMHYLILPNSVDKVSGADQHDPAVKEQAVQFIQAGLPQLLFIHFPDTDRVGHTYGWLSSNQLQSISFVDGMIGEIVAALEADGYLNSTLLIVTSDHGGHGRFHGDDSPEDRTIPWLAVGPGVVRGLTLTSRIDTYDTAATAAYALGLPLPKVWDGRPVLEIFEDRGTNNFPK